jgi:hypothetical protein
MRRRASAAGRSHRAWCRRHGAFGISGYNEGFYTVQPIGVRNPYDRSRIAGGSSSGTGAAIGALCQGWSLSLGRPCLGTVMLSTLHALLVPAYHLLARHYAEPGADYFDRRHTERATRRAVRPLERHAYRVTLERAT